MKKTFALLLILTLSNSCSQVKKELTNSLWEQEGYDRILKIGDSDYIYYNKDNYSCSELAQGDFNGRFKIIQHKENLLILNPGGIVDYRFKRITEIPNICNGESKEKDNSYVLEVYMDTNNKSYEGDGINVDLDTGYPIKRDEFYNSFFNSNKFSDKLIEDLIKK